MIRISEEDYAALRAHGEETYPYECCGVLLGKHEPGRGNRVSLIVRAGNTRTDSAHNRYNIAPQELVRHTAAGAWTGLRYRRFLPLAPRSSGTMVTDGLCRGALDGMFVHHYQCR